MPRSELARLTQIDYAREMAFIAAGKLAGGLGYLFGGSLLIFGGYERWFFYAVFGIATLAALEALAIFLTASRVDEHRRSILFSPRRAPNPHNN